MKISFTKIIYEFLGKDAVLSYDDNFKKILDAINSLSIPDRNILITYADLSSLSLTAKEFNISIATVRKIINKIREDVKLYISTHN